jgi:hypothetical protein
VASFKHAACVVVCCLAGVSPHGVRQMYSMFGLVASMPCTMSPVSSGYELPPQPLVCPAGMFVPKLGWDVFHSSGPGP